MVLRTMLLFPLELHRSLPSFVRIGSSFDTLLEYAENWNALTNDAKALIELFDLIYHYASEVHGRVAIKKWLKTNRDKSVLDRLDPTDVAFALLVFENYSPKWVEDIETDRQDCAAVDAMTNHEEDEKNKRKRNGSAQDDEGLKKKKKRRLFVGKYTKHLQSGWSKTGMQRYEELCRFFNSLFHNQDVWLKCKEGWDEYVMSKKQGGGECWVPTYHRDDVEETDSDQDNGSGEGNGWFQFVVPKSEEVDGGIEFKEQDVTHKLGV